MNYTDDVKLAELLENLINDSIAYGSSEAAGRKQEVFFEKEIEKDKENIINYLNGSK